MAIVEFFHNKIPDTPAGIRVQGMNKISLKNKNKIKRGLFIMIYIIKNILLKKKGLEEQHILLNNYLLYIILYTL